MTDDERCYVVVCPQCRVVVAVVAHDFSAARWPAEAARWTEKGYVIERWERDVAVAHLSKRLPPRAATAEGGTS